MNPLDILSGIQAGTNVLGQGGNLLSTLIDLGQYGNKLQNPVFGNILDAYIRRYNQNQSPYAINQPEQFGNSNFGNFAVSNLIQQLQNNPVNAAMAQLQSAAGMQGPQMASMADMFSGSAAGPTNAGGPNPYSQQAAVAPQFSGGQFDYNAIPGAPAPGPIANPIGDTTSGGPLSGMPTQGGAVGQIMPGLIGKDPSGLIQQITSMMGAGAQGQTGGGGFGGGGGYAPIGNPWGGEPPRGGFGNMPSNNSGQRWQADPSGLAGLQALIPQWLTQAAQGAQQGQGQTGGGGEKRMPSYAVGTPYVQQTGPAQLHQGEAVVPAQQNPYRDIYHHITNGFVNPPQQQQPYAPMGGNMNAPSNVQTMGAPKSMQDGQAEVVNYPGGSTMMAGYGGYDPTSGFAVPGQQEQPAQPQMPQQPQAPAAPTIASQQNSLMSQLLGNPNVYSPELMGQLQGAFRDTRNQMLQPQQTQQNEMDAARGFQNSGVNDYLRNQNQQSANQDIANFNANLGQTAANTNWQSQMQAANAGLGQILGMGGANMQYQQLANQMFNQNRDYATTLAGQIAGLGGQGQAGTQAGIGAIGGQVGAEQSDIERMLSNIFGQLGNLYAPTNAAPYQYNQGYGYMPQPQQQNQNNGWSNLIGGVNAGANLGALFV